ncbi:cytochrome ubiquinol oxidase subunit I [Desulfovibrio litoralis]|uniref:Cytochrome bd-I ubiquinol oxidase subunit 1 apoprotein n=1 Tax=Desulfovibrio litoralis DSM 11393 TaxID=1121455 RepID=A0A1M7TJC9_9BACT|nr:cytochrome ubiquinol oxidase subunit I [Desulfovibrio litoralis]SHN70825.1 cytochrome bd-I ubiquinol oxidase subunit 1 apoprotein [Desulfovibrio litoralis DSM 11393]
MDDLVVWLSRVQFATAVFFHFIFVPLTLGLAVLIAFIETLYVRTGNEVYKRMAKFWGKLFIINFTLGVVTGITLEFQFGTNWSRYSEYVGDIFGSLLAIEATLAFFLESTFLAVWIFGWEKVSKKVHLFAIWMVALASNISAVWIILANGWMQNPVGYTINNERGRAELANFWEVLTNEFAWGQFFHNTFAAWMLSGFFVLGISAWHLLRKNEVDFFRRSFKIAAYFTFIAAILVAVQGHNHGQTVARLQPAKMAAMESHWETSKPAGLSLLVVPDEANSSNAVQAITIPGLMSFLAFGDFTSEVKGLNDFPKEDRPPVLVTFLSFRLMAGLGVVFLILSFLAWRYRENIEEKTWLAKLLPWFIPIPYIAVMAGWTVAEVGRQPWIVYGMMRTRDAISPVTSVPASSVAISLAAFVVVYSLLGILDIYLLRKYARKGPNPV